MKRNKIYQGDALEVLRTFPDESVHMCVTSPPYFGHRTYDIDGQIGLEEKPEEYVQKIVDVFVEVHRVLRADGTFWLNLGDSFASNGIYIGAYKEKHPNHTDLHVKDSERYPQARKGTRGGEYKIKAKDLMGIPWRVAFALQDRGWYLRNDNIWAKPNCMPSPIKDRCTSSHEHVFMFSKNQRYFFDQLHEESGANKRDVWWISPQPFNMVLDKEHSKNSVSHFATFPEQLAENCILAGTSEHGCCADCGAQYTRVVEKGESDEEWKKQCGADSSGEYKGESKKWLKQDALGKQTYTGFNARWKAKQQNASDVKRRVLAGMVKKKTTGWKKTCKCVTENVTPAIVLDPFHGVGTSALVSLKNGRDFVGIELNPDYIALAEKRIAPYRVRRLSEF